MSQQQQQMQRSIDSIYHSDYISSDPVDAHISDIAELYDNQNNIFFISLLTGMTAIIVAVMISNNR